MALAMTLDVGEALACKCGSSSYGETIAAVPVAFEGGSKALGSRVARTS